MFIQNLPFTVREEDLRDLFQDHNLKVSKLQILKDGKGSSKGIGFAEFETAKDASTAVNRFNDFELQKRKMRIEFAKPTFSK